MAKNILYIWWAYIWTCERFARHLRETCESFASNVYCCLRLRAPAKHLRATCVWFASKTCEYLRASACGCHKLRVIYGNALWSIFNENIFFHDNTCWLLVHWRWFRMKILKRPFKSMVNTTVKSRWSAVLSTKNLAKIIKSYKNKFGSWTLSTKF